MAELASETPVVRFEPFVLDLRTSELRKAGVPVRLQQQPCKILALLACRAGTLVTRQEIRHQIWGYETYVDFEKGINSCVRLIRAALGDDAKKPSYIETLPRRGYRFIGSPQGIASAQQPSVRGSMIDRPHHHPDIVRGSGTDVIAVLPFDNLSGDRRHDYLSDGMTETLTTSLAQIGFCRVVSRASAMRYKGVEKPMSDIAEELSANLVTRGTVLRSSRGVRITTELIDPATEQDLWAGSYERRLADVLTLLREAGLLAANEIRMKIIAKGRSIQRNTRPVKFGARLAYVNGYRYWSKWTTAAHRKAIEYFQEAIQQDPGYALPYAGLADCYLILAQNGSLSPQEAYPKARAAAMRALELDDGLAEAHASLAYAKMISEWKWAAAEDGFRKAIELNPSCATAHQCYADCLTALGRHDEAISEMERAWELDPLSPMISTDVAWSLSYARQYDQAIEQYRMVLEREPSFLQAHWGLGLSYLKKFMFEEAVQTLKEAVSLSLASPITVATLGYAYALWGKRKEAQKLLRELKDMATRRYVPSYDIATLHWGLGEKDEAFAWLQKAYNEHSAYLVYLRADPRFEIWHSDPRLRVLVSRMGLSQ
jgi:TolB-like protein/Flp pilus assembly protein TadD